ncbi:MAG: efflux RND transporter permease subunit, partial [Alphaproteobacteria bacterium]|nr:efflux RND transporter permease subunit [Alphaproteobacteria bacterium]
MNISEIFIRRPVATILMILALLSGGLVAYTKLPVAALPQADFPTISVSANLAGASPDTMASAVATPLIKQFQTIDGVDTITASSNLGSTNITIQFNLSRNIDAAAADVQAAISRTQRQLPANMTTPPSYRKANPASFPVLFLALTGDGSTPLTKMDDIAQNIIAPALSTLTGVAQAQVFGAKTYAVRIEVDPAKLTARGMSLNQLASAIKASNDQTPLGAVQTVDQSMTIESQTQRTDASSFRSLIIARNNGGSLRLEDIATVQDSYGNLQQGSWLDGKQSIVVAVFRQPAANTVELVQAVKNRLPSLEAGLPGGMKINVINDASVSIKNAIHDVAYSLGLTILLVVAVIFLFLRRISATFIPALAVPLSLLMTFGLMYYLGYSVDNISLLGLTLSVGLVVDDAIVMLENIVRLLEQGEKPLDAALKGSREVTSTIISMSLSLVAVFIPILMMGGIIGKVFNEFGVVVTIAILSSAFVSLTVTPMLAARLPHAKSAEHEAKQLGFITRVYAKLVSLCLRNKFAVMVIFFVTAWASLSVFNSLPRSLFPAEDIGSISISMQARQDISYPDLLALQQEAANVVAANPAVEHLLSFVGGGPGGASNNSGSFNVQLKDKSKRGTMDQVVASLRKDLAKVGGMRSFVNPQQSLNFGGRSTQSQYQLV